MTVKYCVVMGCPRSGTTFLIKALNALPYSECINELLIPVCIPHIANHPLPPTIYNALQLGFETSLERYANDGKIYSRLLAIQKYVNGYMDIQELFQALRHQRKIEHLIYKEPYLSFAPEFTYHALPESKIIYIYRDGRDCADSNVRTYNVLADEKLMSLSTLEIFIGRQYEQRYIPWWVEAGREGEFLACTPYVRTIWMWKEIVSRCHNFFSHPDVVKSGRVLLIKYEDLVNDSLKYGEIIVEHLGGKMNAQLQKQFQQAHPRSVGIYKKRNPQEIQEAEEIAKQELTLYGYL